jgi:hypothetical protein
MIKPTRAATERPNDTRLPYEGPVIDIRRTLFSVAVVVAIVIISGVVSREIYSGLLRAAIERSSTPLYGEGLVLPPEPRLEGIDMMSATVATNSSSTDEDRLQKFGWIDRERTIIHIPIQKAMELAVEQGWLRSTSSPPDDRPQHSDIPKPAEESSSAR